MKVFLILHDIRSLHNVGSIFRTADAAGVSKIYLTGITPAPTDRFGKFRKDFIKVSLGAERTVPWEKTSSTTRLIKQLKRDGWRIFAVEQSKRSIPYYKATIRGIRAHSLIRIALVVGNEVHGLPPSILNLADKILEIPMRGAMIRHAHHPRRTRRGKESLNVAVAAGIVLYGLWYNRRREQ